MYLHLQTHLRIPIRVLHIQCTLEGHGGVSVPSRCSPAYIIHCIATPSRGFLTLIQLLLSSLVLLPYSDAVVLGNHFNHQDGVCLFRCYGRGHPQAQAIERGKTFEAVCFVPIMILYGYSNTASFSLRPTASQHRRY